MRRQSLLTISVRLRGLAVVRNGSSCRTGPCSSNTISWAFNATRTLPAVLIFAETTGPGGALRGRSAASAGPTTSKAKATPVSDSFSSLAPPARPLRLAEQYLSELFSQELHVDGPGQKSTE